MTPELTIERVQAILRALQAHGGNRTKASEALGIHPSTMGFWLRRARLLGYRVPEGKRGGRGPDRVPGARKAKWAKILAGRKSANV